ncbi:hypothetical protein MUP07_05905 [Candidatus Bathyarchaeota archaeon]|nr:hypothetical protein [Candidatus Bathyarchaeota archaeon]
MRGSKGSPLKFCSLSARTVMRIAAQMDRYRTNAYYVSGKVIMWNYISGNMRQSAGFLLAGE